MISLPRFTALACLCVSVSAIIGPSGNASKVIVYKTDTYLDAYSQSRIDAEKAKKGVVIVTAKDGEKKVPTDTVVEKKISNREDSFQSGYDYSPPFQTSDSLTSGYQGSGPADSYLPQSNYNQVKFSSDITYNAPANNYGPPAQTYGPPAQTYGPPSHNYGPPAGNYGPSPNYGPPAQSYGPPKPLPPLYGPPIKPSYGVPYSTGFGGFGAGLFEKLAFKLDILTVAKLLLKFMIFKKIVTMIGVICMLLVIPKLINFKKNNNSNINNEYNDEEGEERDIEKKRFIELSSIQQMFERAVTVYSQQQPDCGFTCRAQRVIDDLYKFQPYFRWES